MNLITYLRQFRFGGIAIFDLAVSYIGIYLLAPLLSKMTRKIGLNIGRTQWLWLTLPIGVLTHLLVGQQTALNEMLLRPGNYLIKTALLLMIVIGLKGVKIKNSKK